MSRRRLVAIGVQAAGFGWSFSDAIRRRRRRFVWTSPQLAAQQTAVCALSRQDRSQEDYDQQAHESV